MMERMEKIKIILLSICLGMLLILSVYTANVFPYFYYLFYNGIYGIILSLLVPLIILYKNQEDLKSVGFKKHHLRQWIVLTGFVIISVGGQIIPLIVAGTKIQWSLIKISFFPLIMTTFFEEFLFRGFIQTRIEKQFGFIVAILISGLMFSVYHIGYPGFRSINDLLLLFAVGIGFALAFKLSGNNLYVSYFVNLPNAFITYILKSNKFSILTIFSSIIAVITIILIVIILIIFIVKNERKVCVKAILIYDDIKAIFTKKPKILYGFTSSCIDFGEYKDDYKSALVYAVPHVKIMDIKSYKEEILEQYIILARNEINDIQNKVEKILLKYSVKYIFPSITQKAEENLLAPISFKQLGVNAGIGWIGKNDLLVSNEYGPRLRLGAVLIDYDFPPNNLIKMNNCPENCVLCINACPYKALKNKLWIKEIKRGEIIDYKLCNNKRSLYINKTGRKHPCGYCLVSCIYGLNKNDLTK